MRFKLKGDQVKAVDIRKSQKTSTAGERDPIDRAKDDRQRGIDLEKYPEGNGLLTKASKRFLNIILRSSKIAHSRLPVTRQKMAKLQ